MCANFCVCTFVNVITGVIILHRQDVAVDHCACVSLLCAVVCDYVSYLLQVWTFFAARILLWIPIFDTKLVGLLTIDQQCLLTIDQQELAKQYCLITNN